LDKIPSSFWTSSAIEVSCAVPDSGFEASTPIPAGIGGGGNATDDNAINSTRRSMDEFIDDFE
jgi:hypothetical protein